MTGGASGKQVFHVDASLDGASVVAALRNWLPAVSWSAGKRLLAGRRVSVNGAVCMDAGRRLKSGDVVHLFEQPQTPQPTARDVEVLFCDSHVVVAVKPALMTTVRHREERNWSRARKNVQPTLDELLPEIIRDRFGQGGLHRQRHQNRRPARSRDRRRSRPKVYAVHRLDRDTSGVMVFARTPSASRSLIAQFKRHSNERVYRAVVHGRPEDQVIESHIIRDRGDGLRGSTETPGEGQRAVTHVRLVELLGAYSIVECRLETGRTHQIRIHLSERGHLVCGDPLYRRRPEVPPIRDECGAPRLALHAERLAFDHPATSERLEFEAPFPEDLARFVARLRRGASG